MVIVLKQIVDKMFHTQCCVDSAICLDMIQHNRMKQKWLWDMEPETLKFPKLFT